jgi:hypothetical protein
MRVIPPDQLPPIGEQAARQYDADLGSLDGWLGGFPPVQTALDNATVPWSRLGWTHADEQSGWQGLTEWLWWRGIAGVEQTQGYVVLPTTCCQQLKALIRTAIEGAVTLVPWERRVDSGGSHRPPAAILEHYRRWVTAGFRVEQQLVINNSGVERVVRCPLCGTSDGLLLTAATFLVCPVDHHRWVENLSAYDVLPQISPPPPRL